MSDEVKLEEDFDIRTVVREYTGPLRTKQLQENKQAAALPHNRTRRPGGFMFPAHRSHLRRWSPNAVASSQPHPDALRRDRL